MGRLAGIARHDRPKGPMETVEAVSVTCAAGVDGDYRGTLAAQKPGRKRQVSLIERGFMTTIHSYTNDQRMLDQIHSDLRRARAGAMNMIPTTTGAARAVGLVLPELKGKLDGSSVRVPTPNVSLIDLVFTPSRDTTKEELNAALKAAADGAMKGVLDYTDQPLVSSDFNHQPASSTVDSLETAVLEGKLARVVSWYDNEWGFSNRMIDTAGVMAKFL